MKDDAKPIGKPDEEFPEVEHVLGMCSPDDPDYARQKRILRETKHNNPEQYQKFLDMR